MSIGIICEYNPFHNGHLYHINKIKEMYPDSTIILVMSGNYTERGDISIINKWNKAKVALLNNVDLVIELPFVFATQSADVFSKGAISILKYLKVDKLIFGSESNDINKLNNLANTTINNKEYDLLVKKYLNEGLNYPTSLSKALKDLNKDTVDSPNDLLGLCYIKEIIKQNANIEPLTIQRTNDYHDTNLNNSISSATSIRLGLKENKDISNFVPDNTLKYINNISIDDYFDIIKYRIISSDISNIQTVDEGIDNRIKKYIYDVNNIDELINKVKSKRYTYSKLKRMFVHILCNFTKEEALNNKDIKYIRILGFNNKGQNYLSKVKKNIDIPIITNYKKEYNDLLSIDFRVNSIYALGFDNKEEITKSEYKNKPIKK